MVDAALAVSLTLAFAAGLFMSWAIGAVAIGGGAFAPAVGAKAIPVRRAAFLLGFFGFFGAVLQGASVTETVGQGLVVGGELTTAAASIAILLSAVLMAIGAFGRYPIPAAFTVTGAMVGAGLALGGSPAWGTYAQFAALWIVAPFLVGALSYFIATLLEGGHLRPEYSAAVILAMVLLTVSLLEFPLLGTAEESQSVAGAVAARLPLRSSLGWAGVPLVLTASGATAGHRMVERYGEDVSNQQLLIWLGILVAFSGAGNQIGLAVGPVLPLLEEVPVSVWTVMVIAAAGLVVGAWTGAPRLIEAVAEEYASLSPHRAIAALVPAFIVAQVGIQFGIPVSFNEIIIAAIVGSGLAAEEGIEGVGRRKLAFTVAAWVASLVGALGITYGLVTVVGDVPVTLAPAG